MTQEPSTSLEAFLSSLNCIHLHRFDASTQSLTLLLDYHGQPGHYELQGLDERNLSRQDDSNKKVEEIKVETVAQLTIDNTK